MDCERKGWMTSRFLPEQLTESKVIGRIAMRMGFGGKSRHSILDMFKFEMPTVYPSEDIKQSNGYTALDFVGGVNARDIYSI